MDIFMHYSDREYQFGATQICQSTSTYVERGAIDRTLLFIWGDRGLVKRLELLHFSDDC